MNELWPTIPWWRKALAFALFLCFATDDVVMNALLGRGWEQRYS